MPRTYCVLASFSCGRVASAPPKTGKSREPRRPAATVSRSGRAQFAAREVPFPPCAQLAPWGRWISQAVQSGAQQITSFADLGASKPVIDALNARSITKPFPVQEMVIRDALAGHDLLVQSPTGSGKTLAFGVPLVDLVRPEGVGPGALVLAPTRELASQIVAELSALAKARRLKIAAVYGGVGFGAQITAARRADILVATPGRLEDLIGRGAVSLERVRVLVLDEADRMLDMGFRPRSTASSPRFRSIARRCSSRRRSRGPPARWRPPTPEARAPTLTPSPSMRRPKSSTASCRSTRRARSSTTSSHTSRRRVPVVRSSSSAPSAAPTGWSSGYEVVRSTHVAMHGDKSQRQRERALARFERGEVMTLVATDVAARGIDIPDVAHVINYDAPEDRDAYVHRVGRTGRAGRTGTGISFVLADQAEEMGRIKASLGLDGPQPARPAGAAAPRRRRKQSPAAKQGSGLRWSPTPSGGAAPAARSR